MTTSFLLENGEPDIEALQSHFARAHPMVPGGVQWLDDIRFCRWPNQFSDGRKHDVSNDPDGEARPWDGASDCRPYLVDDIINERVALKTTAFWRALMRPGSAATEAHQYAVTLADHLVGTALYDCLTREVELSAQYEEHYGWHLLAPRWVRQVDLKRVPVTMAMIENAAAQAAEDDALRQLPNLIRDPELEEAAVDWVRAWLERYTRQQVPAELLPRMPEVQLKRVREMVRELRDKGQSSVALPYVCRDEPEIVALKPWEEAFIPSEFADERQLVIQRELVSETDLRGKIISEEYDKAWVEEACKYKGELGMHNLTVGESGRALATLTNRPVVQYPQATGNSKYGLIEVLYAVYRATDEDGVPGVYCTTLHRSVKGYGKHELVDSVEGGLPYVAGVREWWTRSVVCSRGVPEVTHTHQNLVKGVLDGTLDRMSMSLVPPVNVYESPTGARYRFGPAAENYVRQGREPQFMQMPSGTGLIDATKVYQMLRGIVDNGHGLMSEDVPAPRVQLSQSMAVQRFLLVWSKAIQQMLCLCQKHMSDAEFSKVTGAPDGWLESRRMNPGLLKCELHFDVRELDPELVMEQIKAVNNAVLPTDTLGTVNRGTWTRTMLRAINPVWSKELIIPQNDASQQTFNRARQELIQMFAGNPPQWVDDKDPTAGGLLQFTQQILMNNPVYLSALTDEALIALAGQAAPQLAQQIEQMGGRNPNARFSGLLVKWLENLKFVGVTQPQNAQIGRIGVRPEAG